ncbi:MAG: PAS domain-containing protein [Bryobacterales bacterium]|nr:PAS domain-containing protein [Bryobacterales bacterium]
MAAPNELSRRGVALARTMLLVSGSACLFFLVGLSWQWVGHEEELRPPVTLFLTAGVLFAGVLVAVSVSLLRLAGDPSVVKRGAELQSYGVKSSGDPIVQLNDQLQIVAMNPAAERRFGHTQSAIRGMPLSFLAPPPPKKKQLEATEPPPPPPVVAPDQSKPLALRAGTRLGHLVQPMLGYTEMAMAALTADHPVRADLAEIGRASARVALLAQTLEVYGGADRRHIEPTDLGQFLERLDFDLRFTLQPGTQLHVQRVGANPLVLADAGLTRLTLLLLVCNAEDAMPAGGAIHVRLSEGVLTVSDSGAGIAATETLFEPLASTKDPERGVGLGLHTAREAMRSMRGDLELRPNPAGGTSAVLTFAEPGSTFA